MGGKQILAILVCVYLIGVVIGLVFQGQVKPKEPLGAVAGAPMQAKASKKRVPTHEVEYQVVKSLKVVRAGEEQSMALVTQPGSICTIRVVLPLAVLGNNRLVDPNYQSASAEGLCQWTWRMPSNTPEGNYSVVVSVGGKTGDFYMRVDP